MKKLYVVPNRSYSADDWWLAAYQRLFRGEAPPLLEQLDHAGDGGVWVSRDEWKRFLYWAKRIKGWTDGVAFALSIRGSRWT